MLKSFTATMLYMPRSYARPNLSSSHFMERLSDSMAYASLPTFSFSEKTCRTTSFPSLVQYVSSILPRSPATMQKR